jgi:hypothetical protein
MVFGGAHPHEFHLLVSQGGRKRGMESWLSSLYLRSRKVICDCSHDL